MKYLVLFAITCATIMCTGCASGSKYASVVDDPAPATNSIDGMPAVSTEACSMQSDGSYRFRIEDGKAVPWAVLGAIENEFALISIDAHSVDGVPFNEKKYPIQLQCLSESYSPFSFDAEKAYFRIPVIRTTRDEKPMAVFMIQSTLPEFVIRELSYEYLEHPGYVVEDVTMKSELLTTHHGHDVYQQTWIARPDNVTKNTPVIYNISGFQYDRESAKAEIKKNANKDARRLANGLDAVLVFPNVCVRGGHHGFVDSQANGPVGTMFVEEFMPWVEEYLGRSNGETRHYITGHSSGGWSTAWLFLNWPDKFEYALATSPDPVDFRDFHGINLYEDDNAFVTNDGMAPVFVNRVRESRDKEKDPAITFDELISEHAGSFPSAQLAAYEAAFSPCDENGVPLPILDRDTGEIDKDVAEFWRRSDVSQLIQTAPGVDGEVLSRLHFSCGTRDEYGLHRPLRLLEDAIEARKPVGVREFINRDKMADYGCGLPLFTWHEGAGHGKPARDAYEFYKLPSFEYMASSPDYELSIRIQPETWGCSITGGMELMAYCFAENDVKDGMYASMMGMNFSVPSDFRDLIEAIIDSDCPLPVWDNISAMTIDECEIDLKAWRECMFESGYDVQTFGGEMVTNTLYFAEISPRQKKPRVPPPPQWPRTP